MNGVITTIKIKTGPDVKGGFGFIRDEAGTDRFFHARDLVNDDGTSATHTFGVLGQRVAAGERPKVTFEPVTVPANAHSNGLRAVKVLLAN